jgi:hypothetical protein
MKAIEARAQDSGRELRDLVEHEKPRKESDKTLP